MANFKLTRHASADIEAILEHSLAEWGERIASEYLDALEARIELLAEKPLLGLNRPELAPGARSFLSASHIVYFTPEPDGALILRVLHRRQDPQRHV